MLIEQKPTASSRLAAGFERILGYEFLAILASESQPTTRCLDANDGWHDGVRRDDAFCS